MLLVAASGKPDGVNVPLSKTRNKASVKTLPISLPVKPSVALANCTTSKSLGITFVFGNLDGPNALTLGLAGAHFLRDGSEFKILFIIAHKCVAVRQ
jgi:hypothetical protein